MPSPDIYGGKGVEAAAVHARCRPHGFKIWQVSDIRYFVSMTSLMSDIPIFAWQTSDI